MTTDQKNYVKANCETKPLTEITKDLGVNYIQVYSYVRKNNLSLIPSSYHSSKKPIFKPQSLYNINECDMWWSRFNLDN
jgi:hypothetical protein